MRTLGFLVLTVLFVFGGFVAGGLFARFVLIEDNTGFAGATTVVVAGSVGAAIGLVLAVVLLWRTH